MTEPTEKHSLDSSADEKQLDEYLKGDSSVSRHYRELSSAEVPASLDRLVLRQAEDAVKRRPSWVRWGAPLAVAASAVLVVSIVMETGLRDETMVSSPAIQAEAPIETKLLEEKAEESVDLPAAEADVSNPVMMEMPEPAAPMADRPPPPPVAAPAVAPQAAAGSRSAPSPAAPPPETFSSKSVAYDAAAAALREEVAKRAEVERAAFEAADRAGSAKEERSAAQQAMRGQQQEVAGPRDTVDKPEPVVELSYSRPMSASAVNNVATLERAYSDPEQWLKAIRQLRVENKQEEADREWLRFRTAFPNYEVAETDSARAVKK